MFTVGQRVRIISGGYSVEGFRDGEVVTVHRITLGGYDCKSLEGTESFENYPIGLYFLSSELVAVDEATSAEKVTTMDKGFYRVTEPTAFARIKNTLKYFEGIVYIKEVYPYYSPYEFCLSIGGEAYWESAISSQHFERVTDEEAISELGFKVGTVVNSTGLNRLWVIDQIDGTTAYMTGFQTGGYNSQHVSSLKKASEEFLEGYLASLENIKAGKTPYAVQINKICSYRGLNVGEVMFTHKAEGTDYIFVLGGREIYWDSFNIPYTLLNEECQVVWDDLDIKDKALNTWGLTKFSEVMGFATSEGVSEKFAKFLGKWVNKDQYHHLRMAVFEPKPSAKVAGNIAIFNNKAQKVKGILATMKAGRAIRLMFPELDDKTLAQMVDDYRKEFPTFDYSVKESEEAWAFKHAYRHTMGPYENIYQTSGRKSLANSCMRADKFDHMSIHPCEVYASGDFRMYWTELPDGRIGSRCVVYINEGGKPQAGPIYGTTEASIDFLAEKLQEIGADFYENASWDGARLLYVEERGGIVGPYLDHEQSCGRDGGYLVIGDGRYEACSYNGYISGGSYATCEDCEADLDEDDVCTSESGCTYCEFCHNERYVYCQITHQEVYRHDAVEVVRTTSNWGGSRYEHSILVSQDCIDDGTFVHCESRDKYYESDFTVELHDGSTEHVDDASICYETGDHYLNEDLKECQDGEYRNRFFLDEAGWVTDKDGLYYLPEAEEESEAA